MNVPGYLAVDRPKMSGQVQSPSKDKLTGGPLLWPCPLNSGAVGIVSHSFLTPRRLPFLCAQDGEGQQHHILHLDPPTESFLQISQGGGVAHGRETVVHTCPSQDHPPAFLHKATDSGVLRGRLGFAGPNPLVLKSRTLSSALFQAIKSLTPLLYATVKGSSDKCGTPGVSLHSNYLLP